MRSEWTKLWSLRSTRWSLLVVVRRDGRARHPRLGRADGALEPDEPAATSATSTRSTRALGGWHLAQLAIGVLGVLVITGEYSTGMIRSSFVAVPHRLPVLWAKARRLRRGHVRADAGRVVHGVLRRRRRSLTRHHVETTLSSPHVLRAVIGAALFLTVTGLFGLGLGALVRNTAGGIARVRRA